MKWGGKIKITDTVQVSEFHGNDRFGSAEVPWTRYLQNWLIASHKIFCG